MPFGRIPVAMLALLALAACVSSSDLSNSEAMQTDYVPGARYRLLQDRLLEEQGWPPGIGRPVVVAASLNDPTVARVTVEAYRADPGRWPRILGILPAGTVFRLERIQRRSYPLLDDWYEVIAAIDDGMLAGRKVDLTRISAPVADSRMLRTDPRELARIPADAQR